MSEKQREQGCPHVHVLSCLYLQTLISPLFLSRSTFNIPQSEPSRSINCGFIGIPICLLHLPLALQHPSITVAEHNTPRLPSQISVFLRAHISNMISVPADLHKTLRSTTEELGRGNVSLASDIRLLAQRTGASFRLFPKLLAES